MRQNRLCLRIRGLTIYLYVFYQFTDDYNIYVSLTNLHPGPGQVLEAPNILRIMIQCDSVTLK